MRTHETATLRLVPVVLTMMVATMVWCSANAQSPLWLIGDHVLDHKAPGGAAIYPLPQPSYPAIPDKFEYKGSVVRYSQNIVADDEGNILFFLQDGSIYDRGGFMIADSLGHPSDGTECVHCLPTGQTEVAIVPVPGTCDTKFYIFSVYPGPTAPYPRELRVSMLDLNAETNLFGYSSYGLDVRGALLDVTSTTFLDQYSIDNDSTGFAYVTDEGYMLELPLPTPSTFDSEAVHMDIVDLDDPMDRKILFVHSGARLEYFLIRPSGIRHLGYDDQFPEERLAHLGELEAELVNDQVVVQFTHANTLSPGVDGGSVQFIRRMVFDITDLDAVPPSLPLLFTYPVFAQGLLTVPPVNLDFEDDTLRRSRITGMEITSTGQYTYFIHSFRQNDTLYNYLGRAGPSTQYLTQVPSADQRGFLNTEIEKYIAPDGSGEAMYLLGKTDDGSYTVCTITNIYDPVISNVVVNWGSLVLDTIAQSHLAKASGAAQRNEYMLLQCQVGGDDGRALWQTHTCCPVITETIGWDHTTAGSGAEYWEPGNNPFNNSHHAVRIKHELRIRTGSQVHVENMTFKFGQDAVLVVEPGAYFDCVGCTLTTACPGQRWLGAEVQGNSGLAQTPSSNQGYLRLVDSQVDQALVGALCAIRDSTGAFVANGYGGIVRTIRSTFRNNRWDTRILNYSNGATPNRCEFIQTNFMTDEDMPAWVEPKAHARLEKVHRVRFEDCAFANTNTVLQGTLRGYGIQAFNSNIVVLGDDDPSENFLSGLYCGISISGSKGYTVKGMHFRENTYAMADLAAHVGRFTHNTVRVPDQGAVHPVPPVGLLLFQSNGYIVEHNRFVGTAQDQSTGTWFRGPMKDVNRIYNNRFDSLLLGTHVVADHQAWFGAMAGLEIRCGDYTENVIDYGMGPGAFIAEEQGVVTDVSNLAGNRFYTITPDCSTQYDKAFDANVPGASFYSYYRHDDVLCDPDCNTTPPHYADQTPFIGDPFIKNQHCAQSIVPDDSINVVHAQLRRLLAKSQLVSAIALWKGTIDQGNHEDLIGAVEADDPWWHSHDLRDLLVAHHPLSDEVLAAVLDRGEPLDAWHLCQVFIQNAPVNDNLYGRLAQSGLLNGYFMALVDQAQNNAGPGVKDLLRQEIHLRAYDHYLARVEAMRYWLADSSAAAPDSLLALLQNGYGVQDSIELLLHHLVAGNANEVQVLRNATWYGHDELSDLRTYVDQYLAVTGAWNLLDSTELLAMEQTAIRYGHGSAAVWAALLHHGHWEHLPELVPPTSLKSLRPGRPDKPKLPDALPALAVHPNPAQDRAFATYRTEDKPDALLLIGPQGQLLRQIDLQQTNGLIELDLREFASGIYVLALERQGSRLAQQKLTLIGKVH